MRIKGVKRWLKFLGLGVGFIFLLVLGFVLTWPRWVKGYAEDKAFEVLGRKFDHVELGEFELTKSEAVLRDVVLSKTDVHIFVKELRIIYEPDFWNRRALVHQIDLEGGNSSGTLEGFKELRGTKDEDKKSSGKLDLTTAELNVKDFNFILRDQGHIGEGVLFLTAKSIQGPFEVEVHNGVVSRGDQTLASARQVTVTLDKTDPFPLELSVMGVQASPTEDLAIKDVEGQVTLQDIQGNLFDVNLHGRTEEGQSWHLEGQMDRETKSLTAKFKATDIQPDQLPLADLPLNPQLGLISVDLEVSKVANEVTARGTISGRQIHVTHKRLSRDTVVMGGALEVNLKADLATRELLIHQMSIAPLDSKVAFGIYGRVLWAEDASQREFEFTLHMDKHPCQEVLDAIPKGLVPGLQEFELGGETSLDLHTVVKMSDPDATVLEGGFDLDKCKIKAAPAVIDNLDGPFTHLVQMKNGQVTQIPLMHGHPFFTPFTEIPSTVPAAVLSTEDGSFWSHDGFREKEFRHSLRRNVEVGTFRRGASTLTMQMVKNVLLTHEKTVSRKLQELFLTWVVEVRLPKSRILEIYLNVVEFGPGIYGISQAASHYFGKIPIELTSLEAAFIATLLPDPIGRHEMWCHGELTPNHAKYIHSVHTRMRNKGYVSQEDYDLAETAGIVFTRRMDWPGDASCVAEGRQMEKGSYTQGAISGLHPFQNTLID